MDTNKDYYITARTYFTTTLPGTENIFHFHVNVTLSFTSFRLV